MTSVPAATCCFVEHRRCSRYRLRLPALFSWTTESLHQNVGFTKDIGVGGVFIFAQVIPPLGADVKVELVLPLPKAHDREIRLRCIGRVIRVDMKMLCGQGFAVAGDFGREHSSEYAQA